MLTYHTMLTYTVTYVPSMIKLSEVTSKLYISRFFAPYSTFNSQEHVLVANPSQCLGISTRYLILKAIRLIDSFCKLLPVGGIHYGIDEVSSQSSNCPLPLTLGFAALPSEMSCILLFKCSMSMHGYVPRPPQFIPGMALNCQDKT